MTKKIGMGALLGAGALALTSVSAMAQSPSPSASAGPPSGAPGGAVAEGTIDTSTTTSTTTYQAGGDTLGQESIGSEPLVNTGGAPLVLSMLGSLVAGGAFFLRRKIS